MSAAFRDTSWATCPADFWKGAGSPSKILNAMAPPSARTTAELTMRAVICLCLIGRRARRGAKAALARRCFERLGHRAQRAEGSIMAAYIVAIVVVTDPGKFASYSKAIAGLSERFGGETLVRGPVIEMLEGEGDLGGRVLVSRYPDAVAARAYLASPEYHAAKQLRAGAASISIRLVEG